MSATAPDMADLRRQAREAVVRNDADAELLKDELAKGVRHRETPILALFWFATLNGVTHQEQIVKGLLLAASLFGCGIGPRSSCRLSRDTPGGLNSHPRPGWRARRTDSGSMRSTAWGMMAKAMPGDTWRHE